MTPKKDALLTCLTFAGIFYSPNIHPILPIIRPTKVAKQTITPTPVMVGAVLMENVHISSLKEGGTSSSASVSEVQPVSKDGLGVSLQHQVQSSVFVEGSFTEFYWEVQTPLGVLLGAKG